GDVRELVLLDPRLDPQILADPEHEHRLPDDHRSAWLADAAQHPAIGRCADLGGLEIRFRQRHLGLSRAHFGVGGAVVGDRGLLEGLSGLESGLRRAPRRVGSAPPRSGTGPTPSAPTPRTTWLWLGAPSRRVGDPRSARAPAR